VSRIYLVKFCRDKMTCQGVQACALGKINRLVFEDEHEDDDEDEDFVLSIVLVLVLGFFLILPHCTHGKHLRRCKIQLTAAKILKSSRGRPHSLPLSHHRAYGSRTTAVLYVNTGPSRRSV
jgi:hypothetical protein